MPERGVRNDMTERTPVIPSAARNLMKSSRECQVRFFTPLRSIQNDMNVGDVQNDMTVGGVQRGRASLSRSGFRGAPLMRSPL